MCKIKIAATITAWRHIQVYFYLAAQHNKQFCGLMKVHVACWCNTKTKMAVTVTAWPAYPVYLLYQQTKYVGLMKVRLCDGAMQNQDDRAVSLLLFGCSVQQPNIWGS
jgi:hypothetical protein